MIQKQFTLYMENRPGVLARLTKKLAAAKINIEGISVASGTDVGLVQIVVDNAVGTRRVLRECATAFTVQDVSLLPLRNEPGALARIMDRLARARVNVNYVYATACACGPECRCYAIISAPDLSKVESAWKAGA